jgi:hypothetical protein
MSGAGQIFKEKEQLPVHLRKGLFSRVHFIICRSCFWCASAVAATNRKVINRCPNCKSHLIESMPITSDETYDFDYYTKRGAVLHFASESSGYNGENNA